MIILTLLSIFSLIIVGTTLCFLSPLLLNILYPELFNAHFCFLSSQGSVSNTDSSAHLLFALVFYPIHFWMLWMKLLFYALPLRSQHFTAYKLFSFTRRYFLSIILNLYPTQKFMLTELMRLHLTFPKKMLAGIITCDNVMCFDLISCSLPILHCFLLSLVPLCSQCLLWSSLACFSRKPHGWIPSIAQRHAALAKAEAPWPGLHWDILLGISQCFTVRESTQRAFVRWMGGLGGRDRK